MVMEAAARGTDEERREEDEETHAEAMDVVRWVIMVTRCAAVRAAIIIGRNMMNMCKEAAAALCADRGEEKRGTRRERAVRVRG